MGLEEVNPSFDEACDTRAPSGRERRWGGGYLGKVGKSDVKKHLLQGVYNTLSSGRGGCFLGFQEESSSKAHANLSVENGFF